MSDGGYATGEEGRLLQPGAHASAFHHASDQAAFLRGWSAQVAEAHPPLRHLIIMAEDAAGGTFRPISVWPDGDADLTGLSRIIARAASAHSSVMEQGALGQAALPLRFGSDLAAIIAAETSGDTAALRQVLELSGGWLAARLWESRAREVEQRHSGAVAALDALAVLAAERRAPDAAAALANELVSRFDLTRAAVALTRGAAQPGARLKLAAVSRAAWFRRRGALARAFENAMEEALDQFDTVVLPAPEGRRAMVDAAHQALQAETGAAGLATVLLYDGDRPAGAITLEAASPLPPETLIQAEAIAALAGPVMGLKRRQNAWVAGRGTDAAGRGLRALFGRHRPSYRLAAVAI